MRRLVFDAGPFLLLFTREKGSDIAREAVARHEKGEMEIYMHPNNLAEAYRVISLIRKEKPGILVKNVEPEAVIKSAYATLKVVQDEKTTAKLGMLKLKYGDKPWGDLSAAALSLRLLEENKATVVVILDDERHFEDMKEIPTIRISELH
jgi:predicted nucleic acid-binding protein